MNRMNHYCVSRSKAILHNAEQRILNEQFVSLTPSHISPPDSHTPPPPRTRQHMNSMHVHAKHPRHQTYPRTHGSHCSYACATVCACVRVCVCVCVYERERANVCECVHAQECMFQRTVSLKSYSKGLRIICKVRKNDAELTSLLENVTESRWGKKLKETPCGNAF